MAFQKYSHMDQSLFTRFVRLGIPCIELNAQGRARPSIAKLYNWRYRDLGDLACVKEAAILHRANAGFSYDYHLVDVPDYRGRGESAPSPWFYQNEGEAEYIISVYIYMRLLGYPANKISILTTYNGQKLLIHDVINRQCVPYDFIGPPSMVATVDKFQERHVEDTGPVHLVSGVDDMNIIYQQLYQANFGQYMANSGQVAPGLIEPIFEDVDGVRESGLDGNNMADETKMEVLANGENGDVQSESHSNGETDGNGVLPENDSPETKLEE